MATQMSGWFRDHMFRALAETEPIYIRLITASDPSAPPLAEIEGGQPIGANYTRARIEEHEQSTAGITWTRGASTTFTVYDVYDELRGGR